MRAVVQRVKKSKVTVEDKIVGEINQGLMVLLGVGIDDSSLDPVLIKQLDQKKQKNSMIAL